MHTRLAGWRGGGGGGRSHARAAQPTLALASGFEKTSAAALALSLSLPCLGFSRGSKWQHPTGLLSRVTGRRGEGRGGRVRLGGGRQGRRSGFSTLNFFPRCCFSGDSRPCFPNSQSQFQQKAREPFALEGTHKTNHNRCSDGLDAPHPAQHTQGPT